MLRKFKYYLVRNFYKRRIVGLRLEADADLKAGDLISIGGDMHSRYLCLGKGKFIRKGAVPKMSVNLSGSIMDILL